VGTACLETAHHHSTLPRPQHHHYDWIRVQYHRHCHLVSAGAFRLRGPSMVTVPLRILNVCIPNSGQPGRQASPQTKEQHSSGDDDGPRLRRTDRHHAVGRYDKSDVPGLRSLVHLVLLGRCPKLLHHRMVPVLLERGDDPGQIQRCRRRNPHYLDYRDYISHRRAVVLEDTCHPLRLYCFGQPNRIGGLRYFQHR